MKFCVGVLVCLFSVAFAAEYPIDDVVIDCNSPIEFVAEDKELFDSCIRSGVWREPLLLGQSYDVTENEDCEWCVSAMPNVLRYLQADAEELRHKGLKGTAEEVRDQFLSEVCASIYTMEKREDCRQLTRTYYKEVIAMVASGVPDGKICSLLGKCSVTTNVCYTSPEVVCADMQTAAKCNKVDLCMKYVWSKKESWSQFLSDVVEDNAECTECKMVAEKVKDFCSDSDKRLEVIEYAENLCERFFTEDECDEYVGETLGTLMEMISTEVTPDEMCSMAGMCSSASTAGVNSPVMQQMRNRIQSVSVATEAAPFHRGGLLGADECVFSLEVICADPTLVVKCDKSTVCSDMFKYGYTFGSAKFGPMPAASSVEGTAETEECQACEEMVNSVKAYIQDAQVQKEIEDELTTLCSYFPMNGECAEMIKEYTPVVIALIEEYMDADSLCQAMQMCTSDEDITAEVGVCPEGDTECAPEACCPLVHAVCCSDMMHCCPEGYTCSGEFCEIVNPMNPSMVNRTFRVFLKDASYITRDRRDVSSKKLEPETGNNWWWLDLDKLASVAGEIMSQMRESGACSACKLAAKYAEETDMSEAASLKKEELDQHVEHLRSRVCKEMYSKNLIKDEKSCPLTVESVQKIVDVTKMNEKVLSSDSNDDEVQCPIEALCEQSSTQISDVVETVNNYMCKAFVHVADWLSKGQEELDIENMDETEEWEMMEGKMKEMSAKLSPTYEAKMDQVMQHAALMKEQVPDMEANERFLYYKQIILESLKSEIPLFKKCFEE